MKKFLTLLIVMGLFITQSVSAQIFYTEDFSGTGGDSMTIVPPAGWLNEIHPGGNPDQPWEFYTATYIPGNAAYTIPSGGGFSGDYVVVNSDRYGSGNTQNVSLVTPSINCTGRDWIYLKFSEQFRPFTTSSGTVSVSTNGGTTWEDLIVRVGTAVGFPNPAVESSILVPQATNQPSVMFRFTYSATFGYWWAIDNVVLEEGSPLAPLVGGTTYPINGVDNAPTSFANISSAVNYMDVNGVTGTGNVILELSSGYTGMEPGPISIPDIFGTGPNLGIIFRPAVGFTALTEVVGGATPNQHALSLSGCSYITLDGRQGGMGSSRDWTIRVTGTTNAQMSVRLQSNSSAMTDIHIRNLIMEAAAANTTGAIFQITGTSANTIQNVTVEDNIIRSIGTATPEVRAYGITIATATNINNTGLVIRNNDIVNVYARGINMTAAYPQAEIYGNRIYHTADITQPSATEFSGIYYSTTSLNGVGTKIHSNMVYDIRLTNHTTTTTTGVNGIMIVNTPLSGDRIQFFNNVVSIGQLLTGTAANANVYGIRDNTAATNTLDIFYNSVYIGGLSPTGANNSAAFRKQLSNNINLSNNIFFNARGNDGGTGTHWAIMVNNSDFTSISNNDYFVSGVGGVLGTSDGTTGGNTPTIGDWFSAVPSDAGSFSFNPNYVNPLSSPPNMNINVAIATPLESGGLEIMDITTDFDGTPRYPNVGYPINPMYPPTAPDVGAFEFAGQPVDLLPPTIVYDPLSNTNLTSNRTLTAEITDASGIATSPNGPRLYYRKSGSPTYLFDNTPTINGDDYTFTINASAMGGLVTGDIVEYYVAAQDIPGNVGTNPGGGSGVNPPGTVPPGSPFSFEILPALSGTYTVGTGEMYENLTAVANALSSSFVAGDVFFELTNNYDGTTGETLPITFGPYSNPNEFDVTIRPALGVTNRVTSGDPGSGFSLGVIALDGASYLTFDGRPGGMGTNNEWTIRNARTAATIGCVIRLLNDATWNTLRNLNLESQAATLTTTGVIFFHTSTGTTGNSFNTVRNNLIRPRSDNASPSISNGILSNGSSGAPNTQNMIIDNVIENFNNIGVSLVATNTGNGPQWIISGNHMYNPTYSSAVAQTGIFSASSAATNMLIADNFIGGSGPNATGMMTNTGAGVILTGINITGGDGIITGNTIANITGTGTGTAARTRGINIATTASDMQIMNNTIHDLYSNSTGTGLGGNTQVAVGLNFFTTGYENASIIGNTIYNISAENTSANTVTNMAAGMMITNLSGIVANNRVYNISNKATGTTVGQPPMVSGIYLRFLSNGAVVNNMISVGTGETTNTQFNGIMIAGVGGGQQFYYYNSIVVSGIAGGDFSSFGFVRGDNSAATQTHPVMMRNNAIVNNRTGGGSINYAIANQGTTPEVDWSSDYNMLFSSDISNTGQWGSTSYNFAGWKTASTGDENSLSPSTLNVANLFTDLATANLNPLVANSECWYLNGNALQITGVGTDFNGDARSETIADGAPDIGAIEFTPTSEPPTITVPVVVMDGNPIVDLDFGGKKIATVEVTTLGTLNQINAKYYPGVDPPGATPESENGNVYWDIFPNMGAAGFVYNMTLHYTNPILGTISEDTKIRMAKSDDNGVDWTPYLIAGTGAGEYQLNTVDKNITVFGLNTFSLFTLTDTDFPLPVDLASFTAEVESRNVVLKWTTMWEENNDRFEVMRKLHDDENAVWQSVGTVEGSGTTYEQNNYSIIDRNLVTGKYDYKLVQFDHNGQSNADWELGQTVEIGIPTKFDLSQNYPNPFNPVTKIGYEIPVEGLVKILVYDMSGRQVATLLNETITPGYYTVEFNASSMASGVYFYRLITSQSTITKRMVLVK